jgi:hypothetical protein
MVPTKLFNSMSIKNKLWLWLVLVVVLTIPTVTSLFRPGTFAMHDDMQAMRVNEMVKCIKDFQIPCRWVPNMGYAYGYPQFNYYGPFSYYVMSATNLLGVGVFDSVKVGFILSLILGNIAMFFLGSALWGRWGGLFSTLIYAYAPYRASDLYSRGAMGESWAFVFIPLVILASFNLAKAFTIKRSAILALFFGLLICSHNISTLIFSPALVILFLVFLFQNKKLKINKETVIHVLKFGLSLVWGGLIAGFFFLPVVFEKQFAHTETMLGGYFDYRAHFVTVVQLFASTFWGVGSSVLGPHDDLSFFFGPIMLVVVIASLIIAFLKLFKKDNNVFLYVITFFILGLFSAFMSHEKSSFIWTLLPPLVYLQFPWRFLVLGNVFFAMMAGSLLVGQKTKNAIVISGATLIFLILLNLSFFVPSKWFNITLSEKFSGPTWDKQMTTSIYDYLPIFATHPPTSPAPDLPEVSNGFADYLYFTKGTNWQRFTIQNSEDTTVKLRLFDFPGWIVKVDGKKVEIDHNNELGLITFKVTSGEHLVYAKLTDTPVRLLGNILTIIFLPLSIYFIVKRRHE